MKPTRLTPGCAGDRAVDAVPGNATGGVRQYPPLLLTAADGIHAGKGEKVDHREVAGEFTPPVRQRRFPPMIGTQVGTRVELQRPDEDFSHNTATNRPQMLAPLSQEEAFPEDVEPQRRMLVETKAIRLEIAQVPTGQGLPGPIALAIFWPDGMDQVM